MFCDKLTNDDLLQNTRRQNVGGGKLRLGTQTSGMCQIINWMLPQNLELSQLGFSSRNNVDDSFWSRRSSAEDGRGGSQHVDWLKPDVEMSRVPIFAAPVTRLSPCFVMFCHHRTLLPATWSCSMLRGFIVSLFHSSYEKFIFFLLLLLASQRLFWKWRGKMTLKCWWKSWIISAGSWLPACKL